MSPRFESRSRRSLPYRSKRARGRPVATRARIGSLLVACLILFGTDVFVPAPPHVLPSLLRHGAEFGAEGPSALQEAEKSLAEGLGPAAGFRMQCIPSSTAATCSSEPLVSGTTNNTCPGRLACPFTGPPGVGNGGSSPPGTPRNPFIPAARFGSVLSEFHNGSAERAVLFGGANSSGVIFGDTWEFNPHNRMWYNETITLNCGISGNCPSARHDAAWAFDGRRVIVFGGCTALPLWSQSSPGCDSSSSHILHDTWAYTNSNGVTPHWTLVSSTGPSSRYAASMSLDSADHYVLLFGGCGPSTCPIQETWKLSGNTWTQLHPSVQPTARYGFALAESNVTLGARALVLFGGCGGGSAGCTLLNNDTWKFSGGSWTQLIASSSCTPSNLCPPLRYYSADASYLGKGLNLTLLVTGGVGTNGLTLGNATDPGGDWWIFPSTPGSSKWAHYTSPPTSAGGLPGWLIPSPPNPLSGRYDGSMTSLFNWSSPSYGAFLFGGSSTDGSSLGDMWLYYKNSSVPAAWSGVVWPPATPGPRFGAGMDFDGSDYYTLLFGGCSTTCGNSSTWDFIGIAGDAQWESHQPALTARNSPPVRMNASLAYFPNFGAAGAVVLFGGLGFPGRLLGDTWVYNGGNWANLSGLSPAPPARESAAMAYDYNNSSLVMFGGLGSSGPLGDTWLFQDPGGHSRGLWRNETALLPGAPSPRYGAAMATDSNDTHQGVVMFGGCSVALCPIGETWTFYTWPSMAWSQCLTSSCTGTSAPPAAWGASMVNDSAYAYDLMFGGCGATCPLRVTWSYSLGAWTNVPAVSPPPARYDASMDYDPSGGADSYVLLIGGVGAGGQVFGDYGWAFRAPKGAGPAWYASNIENELPRNVSVLPRVGASLAFNSSGNYVVLFGGCSPSGVGDCGPLSSGSDTWTFQNGSWLEMCRSCGPAARWDPAFTYDSGDGYFVLFGGCPATMSTCGPASTLGDTWVLRYHTWRQLSPGPMPTARADATFLFDSKDNIALLFGGYGCSGSNSPACSDSWQFQAGSWTSLSVSGPSARFGAGGSYVATSGGYALLFGGQDGHGHYDNDAWEFVKSLGWKQLAGIGPSARSDLSLVYDSASSSVVLSGGQVLGGAPAQDTWIWTPGSFGSSGSWTHVVPTVSPIPRWGACSVFDPALGPLGQDIEFGGTSAQGAISGANVSVGIPLFSEAWGYLNLPAIGSQPVWVDDTYYT